MLGKSKKLVMCQACRGLIDSSLRTCPLCGRDSIPDAPVRLRVADEHSQFFTKLILGINVAIFIVMSVVAVSGTGSADAIVTGANRLMLTEFGGKYFPLIRDGQLWRLVTANFLHIGIIHLGFNCFALYQIGPLAEEAYGSQKFIFVYLVTGILGFSLSSLYAPEVPSAGASASLMGLIGLIAVYGYKIGGMVGRSLSRQMVIWAAITIGIGLFGILNVDNAAHVGGLLGGATLGFLLKPEQPSTARTANVWNAVSIGCAIVIVGSFAMVGLKYGELQKAVNAQKAMEQRFQEMSQLNERIMKMRSALESSYQWHSASDGDPAKVASDLRAAADDFRSVAQIDDKTDSIKNQYVQIAQARATLFDNAVKDPAAIVNATPKDQIDSADLYDRYRAWVNSVKDQ